MLSFKRLGFCFLILELSDLVLGADLPGDPFIRVPDTSIPDTLLTPLIITPLGSSNVEARDEPGVLRGLLESRQSCSAGYGLCATGGCCPLGGRCCSNGGCCRAGYWCYSTGCCSVTETGCANVSCCPTGARCCQGGGCCKSSENCVITASGVKGCCPIGSTCSGTPGQCSNSAYVPCSNDDFCCPPGNTCYRDTNNTPRCSSPSQNPPPPAATTTTAPPRTTTTSSQALPSSSASSVSTGNGLPTPPSGSASRVISVTDSSITWKGPSWTVTFGPCNVNDTLPSKRTTSNDHSLTFISSTSTAIYANVASYNVYYDVFYNGFLTSYSPSTSLPNCTYVSLVRDLTPGVSVNITIFIYGASLQSRQAETDSSWTFDINNFVIMEPTRQTVTTKPSSSSTAAPALSSANRLERKGIISYVSYASLAGIILLWA
ncbi:hypothetical protein K443DRAFT_676973 [Laccaria amethystina LaAM-08-1]|uniref:Carbohydrate-binding module family 18 protein n=1 Tax=Laccaria amethystina LaAM-08-1 TaxID=1095629 RepID=A0A0C9Y4W9_9AGAR|nr:hypothetical protein K443DRAFT_676973 [Laccaria amethystina LaAM-08-1]